MYFSFSEYNTTSIYYCDNQGEYPGKDKFGQPMPVIGAYIAVASLACLFAMSADLFQGFHSSKFWFPCNYFCFNATSLIVIAVALKLSVDLTTSMPRYVEQLAKLCSSAFICTIMGNSMPSIGINPMNIIAMGILVITVIVNIIIQLATGVISNYFLIEHIIMICIMFILLLSMFSSAIAISMMKRDLELKYEINKEGQKECTNQIDEEAGLNSEVINNLGSELMADWMMAHTSSPQIVLARSVTCATSGAYCLLSTLTLLEAMTLRYFFLEYYGDCNNASDYQWSTLLILIVQTAAVVVGTIAPTVRWFKALRYIRKASRLGSNNTNRRFHVEGYWTESLFLMKERPLGFHIHNKWFRKKAHDAKVLLFRLLIKLQKGIVLINKVTQFVSIILLYFMLAARDCCSNVSTTSSGTEPQSGPDLRRFVLHLEGEEELVEVMMKDIHKTTNQLFHVGEKKEPKHRVTTLDNDQVSSLHDEETTPYGWALPLVTLGCIIMALPNMDMLLVKKFIGALSEGLYYVKFIECNIDKEGKLIKLSHQSKSPRETLETLGEDAKNRYGKYKAKYRDICNREPPSSWPIEVLASNAMYRISQTVLLNYGSIEDLRSEILFEELTGTISDILGACLTNLPYAISAKCSNSTVAEREDSVRDAVEMLGRTKKIIELLAEKIPTVDFSQSTTIEYWLSMHMQNNNTF
ncbi:hypothetical protein HN51_027359 [Arachis hypogaea]